MRAIVLAVLLGLSALALPGCGESKGKKTPLEMKDIPADILKVAKEKLPGVTFTSAYKEPNGSYELRGQEKSGKVREIDIRPDGTVEEIQ